MDHKLISFADIKKQARLDQGQFGVVYRAEYNELTVAAKEITPPDTGQEFVKTFKREVEINSQLDHDNVVKFYGACFDPFCIVMEYVAGGSLYHWIYKRKFQFDNGTILALLLGMTRGLKYLHDLKVLHRDLKSKVNKQTNKQTNKQETNKYLFTLERPHRQHRICPPSQTLRLRSVQDP